MGTRGLPTRSGRALLLMLHCGLGAGACFAAAAAPPNEAPLLTREQLFAPPQRSLPQLSPDGKRIAYLAPDSHGVANNAFVTLLRKRGTKVTYVVYRDEGHGFVRPENNFDFYGRVEEYLAQRLGGRAQPWRAQPGAQVEIH